MSVINTIHVNNTDYTIQDPNIATVGRTGSYNDLTNKPVIPEGATLYHTLGQNTDGAIDQKVTTDYLNAKADTSDLGSLAFADSAAGNFTPSGNVSVSVTPTTTTVTPFGNGGTAASWSASVNSEVLSFSWTPNTVATAGTAKTVMTGATASGSFTGIQGSVTVQ